MGILLIMGMFCLGLMFWSFWSVIVQRMQRKISWQVIKWFALGRSACPQCNHLLQWYNLIPLVSWFRQRGRCQYCKHAISSLYPVLEFVSGIVFALWGWIYVLPYQEGIGELSWFMLLAWWLLGLLLVWDIYTYELHVPVWFFLLVVSIVHAVIQMIAGSASWYMLTVSGWFLLGFLAIYWGSKWYSKVRFGKAEEAFGQGDVMLAPLLWYFFAIHDIGQIKIFLLYFFSVIRSLFSFMWLYFPIYNINHINLSYLFLVFVLITSLLGILYYGFARGIARLRRDVSTDHIHEMGVPMLPFLPAMIVAYWLIVLISEVLVSVFTY